MLTFQIIGNFINSKFFSNFLIKVREFFLPQDLIFFIQTSITYTSAFAGKVQNYLL